MRNQTKKTVSLIAMILVMSQLTFSQNAMNDFDRVRDTYKSLTGLYAEVEYVVFQGHDGTKAVDVRSGIYKSDMKNSFTFDLTGTVQCHNPYYDVVVSKEDKLIVVKKNTEGKQTSMIPGVDTSSGAWKNAVKLSEGNGFRTWRVLFNKAPMSEFEKIDITINTQTYLIKSLTLYYKAKMSSYLYTEDPADNYLPKMTITYKNVKLNPSFSAEEFSEKKYIQISGNEIKVSKTYANYEILIQNP